MAATPAAIIAKRLWRDFIYSSRPDRFVCSPAVGLACAAGVRPRRLTRNTSAAITTAVTTYEPHTYRPYPPISKNPDTLPQFIVTTCIVTTCIATSCIVISTCSLLRHCYPERVSCCSQAEARSRSTIMARTRIRDTAMVYIQNASAMSSMPSSMLSAMLGARVRLTEAP